MQEIGKHNILIADSGATKTDWCLLQGGQVIYRFSTKGISPIFQTQKEISKEIKEHVFPQLKERMPDAISIYGSGCIPSKVKIVKSAIQSSFPIDYIDVHSDLIAATHALCGTKPGIACILGTGSNSCEWNGEKIIKQVPPSWLYIGRRRKWCFYGEVTNKRCA